MPDSDDTHSIREGARKKISDPGRRTLLLWVPSAIFAAIAATFAAAAYRFLRPLPEGAAAAEGDGDSWKTLGPVSALAGDRPIMRKVVVEKRAGWSLEREGRAVYVLPGAQHQVVSAVCPHEQCEVAWSEEAGEFHCPCHDSRFGPEGTRLSGPAERDLERLPSRVENGVLQVRLTGAELHS